MRLPTPSPRSRRPAAPSRSPPPLDPSKMKPPPPSYSSPLTKKRRQLAPARGRSSPPFETRFSSPAPRLYACEAEAEAQDRNIFDAYERFSNDSSPIRSYCDASHVGPTGGDHEPVIMYADESFADALSSRAPSSSCAWSPAGTSGGRLDKYYSPYPASSPMASCSVASSPQASASPSKHASPSHCRGRPPNAPKDHSIEVSTREGDGSSSRALSGNNYVHAGTCSNSAPRGGRTLSTFSSTPNAGDRGEDISLLTECNNNVPVPPSADWFALMGLSNELLDCNNAPPSADWFAPTGLNELLMDPSVTSNASAPMTSSVPPRVGPEDETSNARVGLNPPTIVSPSHMIMASSSVVTLLTPRDWASVVSTSPSRGSEHKREAESKEDVEDTKAELLTNVEGSPPTNEKSASFPTTYSTEELLLLRKRLISSEGIPITWATGNREKVPKLRDRREQHPARRKGRRRRSRRSRDEEASSCGTNRTAHRKGSWSGASGASGGPLYNNYTLAPSTGERRYSKELEELESREEGRDGWFEASYGSIDTEQVNDLRGESCCWSRASGPGGAGSDMNDPAAAAAAAANEERESEERPFFLPSHEAGKLCVNNNIQSTEKCPSHLLTEQEAPEAPHADEQQEAPEAPDGELTAPKEDDIAALERRPSVRAPSTSYREQQREPHNDEVESVHRGARAIESFQIVPPPSGRARLINDNVFLVDGIFYSSNGWKCTVHEHSPPHRSRKQRDSAAAAAVDAAHVSSDVTPVDVAILSDGRNILNKVEEIRERGGTRDRDAVLQRGRYANTLNHVRGEYATTRMMNMETSAFTRSTSAAVAGPINHSRLLPAWKKEEECKGRTTMTVNSWNPPSSGSTARGYGAVNNNNNNSSNNNSSNNNSSKNNSSNNNNGTSSQLRGQETKEEAWTKNHSDWWTSSWKTPSSGSNNPPHRTNPSQYTVKEKKGEEWTSSSFKSDWNGSKDWKTTGNSWGDNKKDSTNTLHDWNSTDWKETITPTTTTKAKEEKGSHSNTTTEWQDWKEGKNKEDRSKDWGKDWGQWSTRGAWIKWTEDIKKEDVAATHGEKNHFTSHGWFSGSSSSNWYDTRSNSNVEAKSSSFIPPGEKKVVEEKQEGRTPTPTTTTTPSQEHAEEPRNEEPRNQRHGSSGSVEPGVTVIQEKRHLENNSSVIEPSFTSNSTTQNPLQVSGASFEPTYLMPDNQRHVSSGSVEHANDMIGNPQGNSRVEPNPMVAPRISSPFINGDSQTFYLYEGVKYRCVAHFPEEGSVENPEDKFLTLSPNDIVVFCLDKDGWAFGECDGREGWFPPSFIEPMV